MFTALLFSACGDDKKQASTTPFSGQVFKLLNKEQTGINFNNKIDETNQLNYFTWNSLYMGAGVGVADFDGDGYQDLFFAGNVVPDKLYLNKEGMTFIDATVQAGINAKEGWSQGVSIGDVNADGFPDIYVCRTSHTKDPENRTNLLYVNNGDGTFTEKAKAYGLADQGFTVQASFFDKDNDGDLDLIVGNQPPDKKLEKNPAFRAQLTREYTSDHLYENQGDGTFKDVTKEAGLETFSHTLNVVASDINDDGWVDLYFSCDYELPDYLFINDGDGTFTVKTDEQIAHISNFSMGSDISDFNNDGLKDIYTLDMAANDHFRSKTNMASMRPDRFWAYVKNGWHYQYMANALQLNNGNGSFSEVAHFAGVAKTDWSWACLFADFDNDSYKDLAISNGIQRDVRNNDFGAYVRELNKKGVKSFDPNELFSRLPSNPIKNFIYKNNGDLTFSEVTDDWGAGQPGFSNGMAYADLDNDGDLDLVMNNVSSNASVYENQLNGSSNYLRLKLKGEGGNKLALNAQVTIEYGDVMQVQELTLTRGYLSSVENILHFGLGKTKKVDKVTVDWINGQQTILQGVEANQVLTLDVASATGKSKRAQLVANQYFESDATLSFKHVENDYDDFAREVLLPHMQSVQGPTMAGADVNGDGLEDVFIGGAAGQSGALFLQNTKGDFARSNSNPWAEDIANEDVGTLFFDADGDNDQDLYVVSGGGEHKAGSSYNQDRLYLNDGKGNFTKKVNALPALKENGQCVKAADIDGDGDLDLFVGAKGEPGRYPSPARSFLLQNNGSGIFTDITASNGKGIERVGMLNDAIFTDYDGDSDADLIVVGEWTQITVFQNNSGVFTQQDLPDLAKTGGWWWSIAEGDFNSDGKPDYVIGNMGKNHKYKATPEKPFTVLGNDFDKNGTNDVVLASYSDDKLLPVRGRQCSSEQMPFIAEKFPTYDGFAKATIDDIYEGKKDGVVRSEVHGFYSIVLMNEGDGKFTKNKLPNITQIAPMRAIEVVDLNKDGILDFITGGNLYQAEVETVRHDAGAGLVLIGDGTGAFKAITGRESGFVAKGDVRDIIQLKGAKKSILVAKNSGEISRFSFK